MMMAIVSAGSESLTHLMPLSHASHCTHSIHLHPERAHLPAAVICPVKNRPKWCAASTTARYPAMLAIDESESKVWARDSWRGMQSMPAGVAVRVMEGA
jgi:hypothetical protein